VPVDRPIDSGAQPDGTQEEQLAVPQRSRWLGGLVVAALVAGVTVWALTRSSHPSRQPPQTTPHSSSPRHLAAPAPRASTLVDSVCHGLAGCSVHADVPPSIVRLARAYLPPGMHLRVQTVVAAGALTNKTVLVARDIHAQVDSVTVLIRVQPGGSGTRAIAPDPLGFGSLLLHHVNAGFVVRLQYLAPETVPPMLDRLRALIRDPRLTSG
jgi:hypothetical protein